MNRIRGLRGSFLTLIFILLTPLFVSPDAIGYLGCVECHHAPPAGEIASPDCCPPQSEDSTSGPRPCGYETVGSAISLTEGNLMTSYPVASVRSTSGAILDFTLHYNSYNADGSKASMHTILGYGWTHTYNVFLFKQGKTIFKMGGTGRVTKYKRGSPGVFYPTTGYFETLVKNPDGTFTLSLKDGTTYKFEYIPKKNECPYYKFYQLTRIEDRNGNSTLLWYDVRGLLHVIMGPYGRVISLCYNSDKKIKYITDSLKRVTNLEYDSEENLKKIIDPMGYTVQYRYNYYHQLRKTIDKNGEIIKYRYNSYGKPYLIKDGDGNIILKLLNDSNWAIDQDALITNQRRRYISSLTKKIDGNGNKWKYKYNKDGYIKKVVAPDGCITKYTYDPATKNLASMTDANGNVTTYEYDTMGNRTKVTDALLNETTYTYDPTYNLVTSMTDPDGDVTTYDYDPKGNLLKETNPLGSPDGEANYTYDSYGNILTVTECNGNTTTYEYDTYGNRKKEIDPRGCETTYTYDIIGNRLTKTDANNHTTTYEYDALDRLIKVTDPKGYITTYTYDGEGNRLTITTCKGTPKEATTTYEYDLRGRLVKVTDALLNETTYTYDGNDNKASETNARGFTTTYEYDSLNRLTKATDPLSCETLYEYDCVGNKSFETDGNGNTTTYTYDALNRMITTTDAEGCTTTYTYNGGGGCPSCGLPTGGSSLIASVTDGNGKVTCYRYDKLDRRIKVIRKVGDTDCGTIDGDDAVTEYTYDCVGNRITLTDPNSNATNYTYTNRKELSEECNPEGECTQYTYDCVGNKDTETRPNGNVITYTYDEKDQLVSIADSIGQVASYTYDCVGNGITEKDGNNSTTQYEYDSLNRLIKVTDPTGEFTTYEYDEVGNLTKITDREGNQTSYTYDGLDRRLTTTDALSGVTSYEYDCVGNRIKITDCNGNPTNYEYDKVNRLKKETYADGGIKEFTYDCVGNTLTRKDQNGAITQYQYNDLYYLLKRDYPGANDDTFTYDKGGRMLTADNLHSATTFTYDGVNRVTQTTQNGLAVNYTYDTTNNRRIITYPGGKVVKEEMDKRDRLDTIKDAIDQVIAHNIYDLGNRIIARTFLNFSDTTWGYSPNNWVIQLAHMKGATTLIDLQYGHDREGNRLYAKKNHDTSNSEKYTYDALYRLIEFKRGILVGDDIPVPSKQCTWTLDCVGNWLKGPLTCPQPGGCAITSNQVNEYANICGTPQTHDNNGNLTDDGTNTYEYDYENRLTKVTRKSDSMVLGEYRYDALSRRLEKEVSTNITRFVYDGGRVIEERQSLSLVAEYIYGSGINEVLTMDRGGSTYYYHSNSLGSIIALTDSAGNIVEHYRYDAYGKPEIYVGPGIDSTWFTADDVAAAYSGVGNPHLFTGRRLDEETDLFYYRARYYSARRGRFLQRDPLGYVDGMNLYEYVRSNPIKFTDPTGMQGECKPKCAIRNVIPALEFLPGNWREDQAKNTVLLKALKLLHEVLTQLTGGDLLSEARQKAIEMIEYQINELVKEIEGKLANQIGAHGAQIWVRGVIYQHCDCGKWEVHKLGEEWLCEPKRDDDKPTGVSGSKAWRVDRLKAGIESALNQALQKVGEKWAKK